jgi:hypothetical protein
MHKAQMNRRLVLMATTGTMSAALARGAGAATEAIWSGEYWATKQRNGSEIRLAMYRKRPGAPQPGERMRPARHVAIFSANHPERCARLRSR